MLCRKGYTLVTLKKSGEHDFKFYWVPTIEIFLQEFELDLNLIKKVFKWHQSPYIHSTKTKLQYKCFFYYFRWGGIWIRTPSSMCWKGTTNPPKWWNPFKRHQCLLYETSKANQLISSFSHDMIEHKNIGSKMV